MTLNTESLSWVNFNLVLSHALNIKLQPNDECPVVCSWICFCCMVLEVLNFQCSDLLQKSRTSMDMLIPLKDIYFWWPINQLLYCLVFKHVLEPWHVKPYRHFYRSQRCQINTLLDPIQRNTNKYTVYKGFYFVFSRPIYSNAPSSNAPAKHNRSSTSGMKTMSASPHELMKEGVAVNVEQQRREETTNYVSFHWAWGHLKPYLDYMGNLYQRLELPSELE